MRRYALLLAAALLAACSAKPTPASNATPAQATTAPLPADTLTPPTLIPTATLIPEPTATPAPILTPLTQGGCCSQPSFSPDGSQVWFIDHPSENDPAGLWGVPLTGGTPQLVSERPAYYSQDGQYIVYLQNNQTTIERLGTGEAWVPPLVDGRFVSISPDSTQITWQVNSATFSLDSRAVDIWAAALDGSNPRQVARVVGGGLGNWFPDSQHVLITRRDSAGADPIMATLNINDGTVVDLVQSPTLRGGSVSPGGGWVAYQITMSGDPANDGFWVVPSSGGTPIKLPAFGPYRWRSEGKLLVVPFENVTAEEQPHRLIEIDVTTSQTRNLTDPAALPFRISNGDWSVSADGNSVIFVSATDRNIWLLNLTGL